MCALIAGAAAMVVLSATSEFQARRPPSVTETFDEVYMLSGFEPPRAEVVAWGRALKGWLQDEPDDARALTAYGGFLECLISRLSDSGGYQKLADEFPPIERGCVISSNVGGRRDYCLRPIKTTYQRALKADPQVEEARLRWAGLQLSGGGDEASVGRRALEELADGGSSATIRYLANLLLATNEMRRPSPDFPNADRWFRSANALFPEWLSGRLGVAAVAARQSGTIANVDPRSEAGDPWYSYPCRVLDPLIAATLAERAQEK
jgi:hypothetical protein